MECTFCTTVYKWFQCLLWIVPVDHVDERGIHPSSSFNRVETANYDLELEVEFVVLVLNGTVVPCLVISGGCLRCNVHTGDSFHDKPRGSCGLRLANIGGTILERQHKGSYRKRN
jgi:hypothetical protein